MNSRFVIARPADGRALMAGTNACRSVWGYDPARAVLFEPHEATPEYSLVVDWAMRNDDAQVMTLVDWRYRYMPGRRDAWRARWRQSDLVLSTGG